MKKICLRSLSYFLATIGLILGFSSKIMAQYGVWEAPYRHTGQVKSEICNQALKGIKVTLENEKNEVLSEIFTDENGYFSFSDRSFYNPSTTIKFTDIDGVVNNGDFESTSKTLHSTDYYRYNHEVFLKFKGKNPCEDEQINNDEIVENQTEMNMNIENIKNNDEVSFQKELDAAVYSEKELNIDGANKPQPFTFEPIQDFLIFPNPNQGSFTISFTLPEKENVNIEVYSNNGQLVYSQNHRLNKGIQTMQIVLPVTAKGTYICNLRTKQNVYTKNFVIQ